MPLETPLECSKERERVGSLKENAFRKISRQVTSSALVLM
jgi:hypothetical protein